MSKNAIKYVMDLAQSKRRQAEPAPVPAKKKAAKKRTRRKAAK